MAVPQQATFGGERGHRSFTEQERVGQIDPAATGAAIRFG